MCAQISVLLAVSAGFARQDKTENLAFQNRTPRYELRPGDVLELNFHFVPAFNQTITVQPDGFVSLRMLGDLQVNRKTVPELTEIIRAKYSTILHDPVIAVELRDFEKPYFIAGGYVERPGKYELRGETTAIQAVAIAGGFKANAKHSQVLLFRKTSNGWVEVKQLDMKKMLARAALQEDSYLGPGDMLFVPQSMLSKVKPFLPNFSFSPYVNPFSR